VPREVARTGHDGMLGHVSVSPPIGISRRWCACRVAAIVWVRPGCDEQQSWCRTSGIRLSRVDDTRWFHARGWALRAAVRTRENPSP